MKANIFEGIEDEHTPEENYPPKGTPERALLVVIDCDDYHVVDYTGRFFHGQIACAGVQGEEVGITGVPDDDPGVYVFENGKPWTTTDWETGVVDDYGIDGDFRKATLEEYQAMALGPVSDGIDDLMALQHKAAMSGKPQPHRYVPDAMMQGDCAVCGHVEQAEIHQ
jgi:hypothetical protein